MEEIYKSELNKNTPLAQQGEFEQLKIGPLSVWPPVVLAPMAGITNYPFRSICRQYGAGLYVSEMIAARPLAESKERILKLADFGPDEAPRSLQLYGTDPHFVREAVVRLVSEGKVDHIDMNFGCPVRKVTRKGGGAAIPLKPKLLESIVRAAVGAAGSIPVTIKFRMGVSDELRTDLQTGRIAEQAGCSAVALHARTAAQLYDGEARWDAIATLKQAVSIPVLGNGDIWEAHDALRMMRYTRCDGVVVGRGCLGRPWLFRDLAEVFDGKEPPNPPNLGEVSQVMLRHARLLADWFGEGHAVRAFRRHTTWYTKGFRGSASVRQLFMQVKSLQELESIAAQLNPDLPFPPDAMRVPRGKSSGVQTVSLPEGYLEDLNDATPPEDDVQAALDGG